MADNKQTNNNRNFFRTYLNKPLCTELAIVELNSKKMSTGITKVCVNDIGPGGLAFTSSLSLPMGQEIIFGFKSMVLNEKINLKGNIIRQVEIGRGIFKYGVRFLLDEQHQDYYTGLFNRLAIVLKLERKNNGSLICQKDSYPCIGD